VLDTGLPRDPADGPDAANETDFRPAALVTAIPRITANAADPDVPDAEIDGNPPDDYLDPVAGHGTFIAGIIETLAPGCMIKVERVVLPLGNAIEATIARKILEIANAVTSSDPTIVTMSFGGQTLDDAGLLRSRIAEAQADGVVFVASAGNDGVCTPQYPAAFDGVISVGALDGEGAAPWTNYGDWVDACAPGTDLVSWFFDGFEGEFPTINSHDPDNFSGWAVWSGTSFAVPVVAARIATEFSNGVDDSGAPITLAEAVHRIVEAPYQTSIPCLGTVVSI
jgi:subtilisin family serine protease